ncbi:hypothetical protein Nocox_37800 [Nonomuraea coxensis DSM 45129]|uniref:Uncharacterized protein n=1 Tax=Nonomuraea coxensis DSM 45129 TaxID=1122611 RepID=A0ABX8UBQ2_9ACTN|nr:hypothetical protein [Nonomuraea coxensis]QYC45112.1 hypothetical protein Nocox_37800 [Nonomuraea coxensis DSM 45129]
MGKELVDWGAGGVKAGRILMIEVMENPVAPTVERPGVAWRFGVVADPSAHDIGGG